MNRDSDKKPRKVMEIEHNLLLCGEYANKATVWSADCDRIGVVQQCFRAPLGGNPLYWLRTNKAVS